MIKEIKKYYCDLCKKQMSTAFGSLHFYVPLKDYMGNICTGHKEHEQNKGGLNGHKAV